MPEPRLFTIIRKADESGVSGTGRVLDGVIFHTGQVVVCWRGNLEKRGEDKKRPGFSSLGIYPSWEAFKRVHIDAHPTNRTEVLFGGDGSLGEEVRASELLERNLNEE